MNPLIGVLLYLAAVGCLAADTFKWVDEHGVTNYGEKPPQSRPAQTVNTNSGAIIEGGAQFTGKAALENERPAAERNSQADMAPARGSVSARGMDFDVFIRLQTGMSEGELLLRAGRPDHEGVENFRHDVVKSYYYFPTVANPYITVVTLRGGRIANLERTRKF